MKNTKYRIYFKLIFQNLSLVRPMTLSFIEDSVVALESSKCPPPRKKKFILSHLFYKLKSPSPLGYHVVCDLPHPKNY